MGEVIALRSCKGCIHVFVCRYRNSVGGKNCTHKRMSKDVRPVVRGRWRWVGQDRWNDCYECSQCGKMNTDNSNFCPNCGAEMNQG